MLLPLFVCVYLCVVCTCLHPCMWRSGVKLGLSFSLKLTRLADYPVLGLRMCTIIPGFYMGAGDLNSGPYACAAGTSSTEPFPNLTCII